eukprot:scaffold9773_cov151-Skeletonema_marinoi.AAC.12
MLPKRRQISKEDVEKSDGGNRKHRRRRRKTSSGSAAGSPSRRRYRTLRFGDGVVTNDDL